MTRWFGSKLNRNLHRRQALRVQSLEERSVLAGDVIVTLSNQVVTITGDFDDNEIQITADAAIPGRITVEGINGTTINGLTDPVEVETESDIRIRMQGGNDIVTFNGNGGTLERDLIVDGGSGDNTFELTGGYTTGRDVKISNGVGFDTNNVDALECRDLYFANGNGGSNTTVFGNNVLGRDLIVVNGTAAGNANQVNISDSAVTRHININQGAADVNVANVDNSTVGDDLTVRNGNATAINLVQIGGGGAGVTVTDDLTVINGSGPDNIFVVEGSVGGTASLRNGNGSIGAFTQVVDLAVTEDLVISNGAGGNRLAVVSGGTVGDDVIITHGASLSNSVTVDGVGITGDLTATNGNGDNSVVLSGGTSIGLTTTIRNGNAAATGSTVQINDTTIGTTLNVINGNGDHTVQFGNAGAVDIGRGATIRNGNGDMTISVDDTTTGQDLTIINNNSTTGASTTSIGVTTPVSIGRDLVIRHNNGGSTVQVNAATIARSLIINSKTGDDTVTVEGSTAAGDLSVGGSTNIDTGSGADTVNLGIDTGASTTFSGLLTVRLGAGDDDLTIGEAASVNVPLFLLDGGLNWDTLTVTNGTAFDPIDPIYTITNKIKNFEVRTT